MRWDGRLFCAERDCPNVATHVVFWPGQPSQPTCLEHKDGWGRAPGPLPDLAALRLDSERLARVRGLAQEWLKSPSTAEDDYAVMDAVCDELGLNDA